MIHALPDPIAGATHVQTRDVNATPDHSGPIVVSAIPGTMDGEDFVPSPYVDRLPGIIPPDQREAFDAFCEDRGKPADVDARLDLTDVLAYLDANDLWGA